MKLKHNDWGPSYVIMTITITHLILNWNYYWEAFSPTLIFKINQIQKFKCAKNILYSIQPYINLNS